MVLIDEYDKPILDVIDDKEKAKENREVLKNLYSVLKPLDQYLHLVFLTGVSKFSKVSIFSGLNQLNDITIDEEFSSICGYTEEELVKVFKDRLEGLDLDKIREWYNGYSWCGEKVYNPFDILLYFDKKSFRPFWFETGTPTFLMKLLLERKFYIPELENIRASDELLNSFDLDNIEPVSVLFQTGYLSIKDCKERMTGLTYYLSYPNKEVRISFNRYLLFYFTKNEESVMNATLDLEDYILQSKIEKIKDVLYNLFASIPYNWYANIYEYEGYYASIVYSFFASSGFNLIPEDITNKGRIDLTILYKNKAIIIEFKVVENKEEEEKAINQIKEKRYYEKYKGKYEEVYIVDMEFSKKEKNIVGFGWERV